MENRTPLALIACLVLTAGACTVIDPGNGKFASLAPADASSAPTGTGPALIWKIDGQTVANHDRLRRIVPGVHQVSVLPLQNGSVADTLEFARTARGRGIRIVSTPVEFDAGQAILVAAVVRRHRTYSTHGAVTEPLENWQTSVLPYVVTDSREPHGTPEGN